MFKKLLKNLKALFRQVDLTKSIKVTVEGGNVYTFGPVDTNGIRTASHSKRKLPYTVCKIIGPGELSALGVVYDSNKPIKIGSLIAIEPIDGNSKGIKRVTSRVMKIEQI